MTSYNLLMVGCGNMGSALLAGWLEAGLIGRAVVVKPSMAAKSATLGDPAVTFVFTHEEIPDDFSPDMVILAVKPQMLPEVLPLYAQYAPATPFLSMAAGKALEFFASVLGDATPVIRIMPNLPVMVRRGVTGCVAGTNVTAAQRDMATALMQAVGTAHWIAEDQIDALSAISASGPAYVCLLQEVLQQAGVALGLNAELAANLAVETIIGTAAQLDKTSEDPAALRQRVTSKGGVTMEALTVLNRDDALGRLFTEALAANVARAKELAG